MTRLGVFHASHRLEDATAFAAWAGRPLTHVGAFVSDWEDLHSATYLRPLGADFAVRPCIAIPLAPSAETLGIVANDTMFERFAWNVLRPMAAAAIVRPGWEMNVPFDRRWGVQAAWQGQPDRYRPAFRRCVDAIRKVDPRVQFDWCPVTFGEDPGPYWPGNFHVDYIGLDVYDQSWPSTADPLERWRLIETCTAGINWHRWFANASSRPRSYPEWGLMFRDGVGGDNPYFVEKMLKVVAETDVGYDVLFEVDSASEGNIAVRSAPLSSAVYIRDTVDTRVVAVERSLAELAARVDTAERDTAVAKRDAASALARITKLTARLSKLEAALKYACGEASTFGARLKTKMGW